MKRALSSVVISVVVIAFLACAAWAGTGDTPSTSVRAQQPGSAFSKPESSIEGQPSTPTLSLSDISGLWFFSTSMHTVTGVCPPGKPSIGKAMIIQKESQVTFDFISGAVCKPASVCHYTGSTSGGIVSLTNSATVDSEGGTVSNTLKLIVASSDKITGRSASKYNHPSGMGCSWASEIELAKSPSGPGGTAGQGGSEGTPQSGTGTGSQKPTSEGGATGSTVPTPSSGGSSPSTSSSSSGSGGRSNQGPSSGGGPSVSTSPTGGGGSGSQGSSR